MSDALKRIEERHAGQNYCVRQCTVVPEHPCDVVKLARALRDLLAAVTFGPKSDLSPDNPGYQARVPVGFVEDAEHTLEEVAGGGG